MHIQEVFNAIYSNHKYEYIIINRKYKIIEYSDKVTLYTETNKLRNIFEDIPELFGLENEIDDIFDNKLDLYKIPYLYRNNRYINIHIHKGRKNKINNNIFDTLIILFEDITSIARTKRQLIQEKNENELLIQEISVKNKQLKKYNDHMQELVDEEIKKNIEKQKMLELQSRYSQMGEIIGMITHQWKQPLNAISMMCNVLLLKHQNKSLETKVFEEKLNDIIMQIQYMSQTVNDFQNFFNPIKERINFNVYDSIQGVIDLIRAEYLHKNIKLTLTGEQNLSAIGLPNELNQVILSILKNSKDEFLKQSNYSNNMYIDIEIYKQQDNAVIKIRDNAGGIPNDIIDNIFEIYVSTKQDGSGIGLSISKNIIENHMNGKIFANNIKNGAEFTIILPTTL